MLKKDLRKKYSELRSSISPIFLSAQSLSISNRLLSLPIWEHTYYHLFLSIASKKEIDTSFVLSILQGKDKETVVPKMKGGQLEHYLLTDNTRLQQNHWGIPEPTNGLQVPEKQLDVIFVPLLAFDQKGNRVGYGKGFYDAFLERCRPNAIRVGLSLFEAEPAITDVGPQDVPLHYCVTPLQTYSFSNVSSTSS
jgi:5-formyltetrahydrofolate cyclo-ligase